MVRTISDKNTDDCRINQQGRKIELDEQKQHT